MSSIIDFTTLPDTQIGVLSTASTASTSRTKIGEIQITNLDTNWEYLVLINYGVFYTTAGVETRSVALSDITVSDTGDYLTDSGGRIRGNPYQTSPSWTTIYTPQSSSLTLNVQAYQTISSGTVFIENLIVKFIPLRRVS